MQFSQHSANFSFLLWKFLTQPISKSTRVILNPLRFWNRYSVQYLEDCWNYDPAQLLERCWEKELKLENPSNPYFQGYSAQKYPSRKYPANDEPR